MTTCTPEHIAELEHVFTASLGRKMTPEERQARGELGRMVFKHGTALLAMAKQTHEAFKIGLMYQDRAEKAEGDRDIYQDKFLAEFSRAQEAKARLSMVDAAFYAEIERHNATFNLCEKAGADRDRYREMAVRLATNIKTAVNFTCRCGSCQKDKEKYELWLRENPDIAELLKEETEK